MFDTKCLELARVFLDDEPSLATDANAERLAQVIQDAIEAELEYLKAPADV